MKEKFITLSEFFMGADGDRAVFSPAELDRLQKGHPGENLLKVVTDLLAVERERKRYDPPQKSGLERIPEVIIHPIDKVSHVIWTVAELDENLTTGLGTVETHLAPSGDEFSLSGPLAASDRLLHSAVATLYCDTKPTKDGSRYFSLASIWKAMGHGENMKTAQRDALKKRLWRLSGKVISINNTGEVNVKGNRYKAFDVTKERLLTFREHRVTVNGNEVEGIEMFNVLPPPLAAFAIGRRQVMQISPKMLVAAGSGPNAHKVTAYILDAISRVSSPGRSSDKVLLSSLYEAIGAESLRQRQQARAYAVKVLDCAKETGLVSSYVKDARSFTIATNKKNRIMKTFINLSNHPSEEWSEKQLNAAKKYGNVVDIPFPNVAPEATVDEVDNLAQELVTNVLAYEDPVAHIMGEMTLVYNVVCALKAAGITCVASTTNRIVGELPDGSKNVKFEFCQFREY